MKKQIAKILIAVFVLLSICVPMTQSVYAGEWVLFPDGYSYYDNDDWTYGWKEIDGSWYHFDEYGYMNTGWVCDKGYWYFLDNEGILQHGWVFYDNNWYYIAEFGCMVTGFQLIQDSWYYFGSDGIMRTGWVFTNNSWYYFSDDGIMQTGWVKIDDAWYFLRSDGKMAYDGWIVDDSGVMAYISPDGTYQFGHLSWIGDSLSAYWNGQQEIFKRFYLTSYDAVGGRRTYDDLQEDGKYSALTAAQMMVSSGQMADYLVFAVGTNGDSDHPNVSTYNKIQQLLQIIGTNTRIVLVTCFIKDQKSTKAWCTEVNNAYYSLASTYPNIVVADWASVCNENVDLYDGLHQTTEGATKFVTIIQNAILSKWGAY